MYKTNTVIVANRHLPQATMVRVASYLVALILASTSDTDFSIFEDIVVDLEILHVLVVKVLQIEGMDVDTGVRVVGL